MRKVDLRKNEQNKFEVIKDVANEKNLNPELRLNLIYLGDKLID